MIGEDIEGALDGPRRLAHDEAETRWQVTPARAQAELEARARLAAHPLARVPMRREGDALVFPRLEPLAPPDAMETLLHGAGPALAVVISPRAFLSALGGPVDAVRASYKAGIARSRLDRFLDRPLALATPRGVDLGGVMPGALRRSGEQATTISLRHGTLVGHPVVDLASLALRAGIDARALHAEAGGDDDAYDIALLHQALRELVVVRHEPEREALRERARAVVERFVPSEPARVRLEVEAPAFLDRSLFAPVGDVDSTHARRVLRDWDGLPVGGGVVRVRTEPALARPGRVHAFEPARLRRRRLFSRFDAGIAYDDEGLYSATPEALADRVVAGLSGTVVDATCGIGSLAIALARAPGVRRVVAIDRDARRLAMAAHNAGLYGIRDRIDFRIGDALAIVPTLGADAVVIDPPWGGRDYDRARVGLEALGMDLAPLLATSTPTVLKLPRSFDVSSLPPGFAIEALVDERGVLKMLVARRGVASGTRA